MADEATTDHLADKARQIVRPKPAQLPATRQGLEADRKTVFRSLNDDVDDAHCELWEQDELYRSYHQAIWDADAVEGSISADNFAAAAHLRNWVQSTNELKLRFSRLSVARTAAIVHSLNVTMRRLHKSRNERRRSVHGEIVNGDEQ
jgi:hypothetical protein